MSRSSTSRLAPDPQFDTRLRAVHAAAPAAVDPVLLDGMIKSVVSSLSGDISLADLQLYREVEALAAYIKTVRRDIAELRPDDISVRHIPMATDELDAVVQATAEATGIILGGMEEVERLAGNLPSEAAAPLGDIVIKVYEACGFQDITGQRISKVVKALRHIEDKIDALLAVFGADLGARADEEARPDETASLLNGPALPTAATNSQADIDALLASFD
ncbi:MAG TPA: protein phosphatase CheZ [Stellaceae bacterium]|nr:protein phosphatase CheZ [Stellaceae bacterium]